MAIFHRIPALILNKAKFSRRHLVQYVQGQSPKPKIREYFYFVDHQGQLFLDDARMKNFTSCFKEKDFLEFFFTRLKMNDTDRYTADFPYLSPCGREKNYIRCDDLPVVFTHLLDPSMDGELPERLSYCGGADRLSMKFEPEKICMLPQSGRVYHPAPGKPGGVGLVKSSLAIELSRNFEFGAEGECAPPVRFKWRGQTHDLTNEVIPLLEKENARKGKTFTDIPQEPD